MSTNFKITTPHTPGLDYHYWWFPNGWRGVGPIERRDTAGRAQGNRRGYFGEWFVLGCNNTDCAGRAVVPVAMMLDLADGLDPEVTR